MIARHARIDFPNEVIAVNHSTDRFIHLRNPCGRPVSFCHGLMLEPALDAVKWVSESNLSFPKVHF